MNVSFQVLFLARAMGAYLLLASVIMLCRGSFYRDMIVNIKPGSGAAFVAASIGLMVGISLVVVHNVWMCNFEGLITLIAWGVSIKSLLWLMFPECAVKCTQKIYSCCWMYYLAALLTGFIGIVLFAHGFFMVPTAYV